MVVFALVVLFSGLFFWSNDSEKVGLTGAAVSNVGNVVAVPEGENNSVEAEISDVNSLIVPASRSFDSNYPSGLLDSVSSSLGVQLDTSDGGLSIQNDPTTRGANSTQCGRVNNSITLTANVNSSSTCFHVNVSNVVIDCQGFTVNYSYAGTVGYGVNNSGFTNVTVRSCRFLEGTSTTNEKHGIYFKKNNAETSVPLRGTIFNNTILMLGSYAMGMELDDANITNVSSNIVNTSGTGSDGISTLRSGNMSVMYNTVISLLGKGARMSRSPNSVVSGNNLTAHDVGSYTFEVLEISGSLIAFNNLTNYGASGLILYLNGYSENVTVTGNELKTNGSNNFGLGISGVNSSLVSYNRIYHTGSPWGYGIFIDQGTAKNILLNNNISVIHTLSGPWEIRDDNNDAGFVNYLIYNNSYGEIKWIDNGTGGFLRNMDVSGALGLDINIYIRNNSILFNSSAIISGMLNSTPANITFFDVNYANITQLFKVNNGSYVDVPFIYTSGTNCLGSTCSLKRFGQKKVTFNVTSFSSYAVNGTDPSGNLLPNVTQIFVNASTFENRTDDTLYCWVKGTDQQQDLLLAYWSWYKNGGFYSSGTTEILNNTLTAIATVPANDTSINDYWNCSVRLFDGLDNETGVHNATLQVSSYLCGDSITASATLTANILGCSGTGLTITASDVVLDCGRRLISGTGTSGIDVTDKDRVTIKNCNVSGFSNGILINTSLNSLITNNTINGSTSVGLYLQGVNHSVISLNTVRDTTTAGIFLGVELNLNNTIVNNTILRNKGTGASGIGEIDIAALSFASHTNKFHFVAQNNISHNQYRGIYLGLYTDNTSFQNNFLQNNTFGYFISYITAGAYLNLTNERFYDHASALMGYPALTNDVTVKDSIFVGNTYDLNLTSGIASNITFLNSSLNKNKLRVPANSYAYFKSYVNVNVSSSSGLPGSSVNVKGYDSLDQIQDTRSTAANGMVRLNVMEFYRSNNINYFLTPSLIKITQANYSQNSTSIDLLNVTEAFVNLTTVLLSCGSVIGSNFDLGNNFNCQAFGLNVTAGNVTIDGFNYNLTGNGSGIGINLYQIHTNNIKRLSLQNFSRAVNFDHTNNTNLTGLRIVNNTIGIYFDHSHNNYVYDTILGNNTNISVFAVNDGETNNSLVNVSLYNLENITVVGGATVYRKWYVDVNATFNGGNALAGANVSAFFNSTQTWETSRTTNGNGRVRLEVTELKKNSSEVFYLTPNSINLSFSNQGTLFKNSTVINLTKTNNTLVHLSLVLNCTAPSNNLLVTNSVTFCPGTFSVENITIGSHNVTLTCVNTILQGSYSSSYQSGIVVNGYNNTKIQNCQLDNYYIALELRSVVNFTSTGNTYVDSQTGVDCKGAKGSFFTSDSYDNAFVDLYLTSCNNSIVSFNTFQGVFNLVVASSLHDIIRNNTFKNAGTAISFGQDSIFPTNNTFYYNNFTSISNLFVDIRDSGYSGNLFNITANAAGINYSAQGNSWEDYCDKGRDLNSDGYADASRNGYFEYPYNDTVSTKFLVASGEIVDYGTRMFDCASENQFLSSGGTSTSRAGVASAGGGGAAASAPSAPSAAAGPSTSAGTGSSGGGGGGDFYSAADVKKFLKTSEGQFESKKTEQGLDVYVTLENTGDKPMKINPTISQEVGDPYFMLTRKTLGSGESSGLQMIAKLSYSKNPIAGTLLKAILVNQEEIVIPPGGKVEKALQVKEGFGAMKPMKIQFSSLGETVLEKDVKVDRTVISAAAVDTHENYVDIYAILVPEGAEKQEGVIVGSELTGASILDRIPVLANSNSPYFLELSLNKKNKFGKLHTMFSDQYGPYPLKKGESFLFAQQLMYDSDVYNGDYIVQTKMYHGPALVVKSEFDVTLGEKVSEEKDIFLLWVGLLVVIAIIMGQGIYFLNVHYKN